MDAALIPTLETLIQRRVARPEHKRCVVTLHQLLVELDPTAPHDLQLEWLEDVAGWLGRRGATPGASEGEEGRNARLRLFLDVIDDTPGMAGAIRTVAQSAVKNCSALNLFAETGIPSNVGLFSEAMERLMRTALPEPPQTHDLARLLHRVFPSRAAASWFETLEPTLSHRVAVLLGFDGETGNVVRTHVTEAALILATRLAAGGTAEDIRAALPETGVERSSFLALPPAVRLLVSNDVGADGSRPAHVVCREAIAQCRKALHAVVGGLEHTGISLDLVYRLELMRAQLDRLYALVSLLSANVEGAAHRLVVNLVWGGIKDRSLFELLRKTSRLLARRVIERAGNTGEHYITRSRQEWHRMVTSAGGGGAVTAFTAAVKILVSWAHLPLFFEGLFFGVNYAASFLLIHFLGLTLATKQPSMIAAAIAGSIRDTASSERPDLGPLLEQIVRTARSQLAAVLGNLGIAIPVAALVDLAIQGVAGRGLLDAEYANKVIAAHHPVTGGVVIFAALTGVILWFSSVIAGTFENWVVVRRLPEAFAANRYFRAWFGRDRARAGASWFLRNASAIAGNVSLGFMLGLAPAFKNFTGLPIDVRHVTLSTASLTFAGFAVGSEGVLTAGFAWAVVGIGIIATLNFGVSYALAIAVALRAREVRAVDQLNIVGALMKRALSAPLDFIRPPPEDSDAPTPVAHA